MSRKNSKSMQGRSQEEKDFIRGKSKKVKLKSPSGRLGYSPVQSTSSGAGTHGGDKKSTSKRERKKAKESLRNY